MCVEVTKSDVYDWGTLFRCLEQPAGSHLAAAGRSDRSCRNPDTKNRSAYLQISEKGDFDWALVSCAAAARNYRSEWADVSVFLGAVAPIPYRVESPLLESGGLSREAIESIAGSIASKATPLAHNGYKVPIAQALVRRALTRIVS